MTQKKLFEIFREYSLKTSMSWGVYFMNERLGCFDYVPCPGEHEYHFIPKSDDPDNIKGYTLFSKEKDLREFFDRKALWFKQIKEKKTS